MLLAEDGFNGSLRFRNVLHDDAVIVQRVTCGIIQPQAAEDQGGEHQEEQDRDQQQRTNGCQYLSDSFSVFP